MKTATEQDTGLVCRTASAGLSKPLPICDFFSTGEGQIGFGQKTPLAIGLTRFERLTMSDVQTNSDAPVLLQVLPSLVTGGVERGAVDVGVAAAKAGFRSLVASSGGPMVRELVRGGVEHIELPLASKNFFTMRRNADRLADLMTRERVAIVHARSRAPAWSAYWASRRTGTPFMTTFHATYNIGNPLKKYYNSVMTKGDRVVCISEHVRRHILKNYECDGAALRVIHRGIDIDLFDPEKVSAERVIRLSERWRLPDGVPVVMLPGRLTRWKGQTLLVRALAKLKHGPVRCLLVGSAQGRDAYHREVETLAKKLGVDGMVHVVGDCDDIPAALKLADVVVSASTDPEGFGRVAVEGQAMGRPVVAPSHGAAPEQVEPGVNGWLFEPGNADELAARLDEALSLDATGRERIYAAGIENARTRFTKKTMCDATISLYRELLSAPVRSAA